MTTTEATAQAQQPSVDDLIARHRALANAHWRNKRDRVFFQDTADMLSRLRAELEEMVKALPKSAKSAAD